MSSTVKAKVGGFVGFRGVPVLLTEGEERDADDALVKARPDLFTTPPPVPVKPEVAKPAPVKPQANKPAPTKPVPAKPAPAKPTAGRGKAKGADG